VIHAGFDEFSLQREPSATIGNIVELTGIITYILVVYCIMYINSSREPQSSRSGRFQTRVLSNSIESQEILTLKIK
jgi:hypothetical protein